jgi:lipid-binding SYLF domain-containing protein
MQKMLNTVVLAAVVAVGFIQALPARAEDDLKVESERAIETFKKKDPSLKKFFDESYGFAIFPSVGRGGLVFGGQHGKGMVYEKQKPIGEATLTEINFGAQIGGESFYEVIFFETEERLKDLKENNVKFSAQVNAVAAADGAAKTAKYDQGVAVFTLPRGGLMVQATVGGQKFKFTPSK